MTRAGLLLAVVGYYGLHWLAGVELLTATRAADAGPVVIWQFAKMAGYFLQYLVPLLCVVGYAGGAAFLGLLFHVSELSWCEGDWGLTGGWLERALVAPVGALIRASNWPTPPPFALSRASQASPGRVVEG